jgi:exosortase C (VPDSG-CTERM-specific)
MPPDRPSGVLIPARLRAFGIYASILTIAFALPLWEAIRFAAGAQYYGHVLLIPLISAYLIGQKRHLLNAPLSTSFAPGLFFLGLGAAAIGLSLFGAPSAHAADHHALIIGSFLLFLTAGSFLFLGAGLIKSLAFPIAFLIFAVPLPYSVVEGLQIWLQHASAEAAYWMLSLTNIPMIRDTVDFRLPGIIIHVAEECSGFNSSLVLFIVSLLAGHLFLKRARNKVILALAVIPLAILRNGFRITVISMLCVYVGPEMIHSSIHHRGGPIFFALSMIPFVGMIWALRRVELKSSSPNSKT